MRIFLLLSTYFLGIRANSGFCAQVNCTCLEKELEKVLKNDTPPNILSRATGRQPGEYFSNAHNISRALYPLGKAPAKFILIKVKFYNTSSNKTRVENYIWTLSCVYAVLPRDVLAVVSLGTLYHEREVLELTVPEFCKDVPAKEYMKYALSSLQDFVIIPSTSDPRLNTAECVSQVDYDANDSVDQMVYERRIYSITISTFLTFVCLFGGSLLYRFLVHVVWYRLKDIATANNTTITINGLFALKFTAAVMVIVDGVLFIYTLLMVMKESGLRDSASVIIFVTVPILYVLAMVLAMLLAMVLAMLLKPLKSWWVFLPLSWAVCYNCLWILLGIFAHPSWAFSVLLPICSFILLIYILAYSCSTLVKKYTNCKLISSSMLFMCVFLIIVAFTWISVRFFLANKLISNSIRTLVFAILGTLLSVISFKSKSLLEILDSGNNRDNSKNNQDKDNQGNSNQDKETSETIPLSRISTPK